MSVERLNEIKRQVSVLMLDEKQDLVAFLSEQVNKDRGAEAGQSSPSNGQQEEPDPERRRELEWMKQHRKEYAGQYVALFGDRLVAHADNLRELHRLVKESGVKRAVMTRIETPDEVWFGGW
jgi:predicted TIM-barrel fold metal-dependent hydrolase